MCPIVTIVVVMVVVIPAEEIAMVAVAALVVEHALIHAKTHVRDLAKEDAVMVVLVLAAISFLFLDEI